MAQVFDPQLIKHSARIDDAVVDIYKVGGGTLGKAYIGQWGYRIARQDQETVQGQQLSTGLPYTHQEAAVLAVRLTEDCLGL